MKNLHRMAKEGDERAALDFIKKVVDLNVIKKLKENYPDAIIAPIVSEGKIGVNQLPYMYTKVYIENGFKSEYFKQTVKAHHTKADKNARLLRRNRFSGNVIKGVQYIILDDHVNMGGSLRDLRDYIETNGGIVVAATSLTAEEDSDNLKISDENLKELSKWGESLNETLRYYGITDNYRGLTNKEAKYVLRLLANTRRAGRNGQADSRIGSQIGHNLQKRFRSIYPEVNLLFQTENNFLYNTNKLSTNTLKDSETTEQILFQIEDNLSDLTSSELETVNFQTEQEMAEEARSFKSWEDFKEYIEATASWLEDDEPPLPSGADDAWYKTFWEKAQQADKAEQFTEENTRKQSGNIIEEDESEKDRQWYEMMSEEGKLEEFLIAIGQTMFYDGEEFAPQDQEELDYVNDMLRKRDRARKELRHGAWQTRGMYARKMTDPSQVYMTERERKTMMTLMRKSKRDYRDIWADLTDNPEWRVEKGHSTSDKIKMRIASPSAELEFLTPEQKRIISEGLEFADLKQQLKDGTLEMDLENIQKIADGYENEIDQLKKQQKKNMDRLLEEKTIESELLVKQTAELEKLNQKILDKQAKKEALDNIRDIKIRLIKAVNRRVDWKTINYEEGRRIIAIQALFQPQLKKYVNTFLNSEGAYIRDAYSRYKTDYNYRARMHMIAEKGRGYKLKKVIKIFDTKTFEKFTDEDKAFIAQNLPRTNWVLELKLDDAEKKRGESMQLDLQSEETQQLLKEILPEDMLALLSEKDLKKWTLNQMEDLAAIVDNLRKKGKEELKIKNEARLTSAFKYRTNIENALRSSGIEILPEDSPAVKKWKQKAINRFNKKLDEITGSKKIKGTLAAKGSKLQRLHEMLNGYSDANIRRVARILDNGKEGVNTTLLYYMEDRCFNNEQRAIQARQKKIMDAMEKEGVQLGDLYKKVKVNFADGEAEFTVDELLYFEAAGEDENSRMAVACGNMYDETVKSSYRGSEALQQEYEKLAMSRYDEVIKEAKKLPSNVRNLMAVIQEDYSAQYDKMNAASIDVWNTPVNRVKNYVPLVRLEMNGDTNANRVKEDLLGASQGTGSSWVDRGMTKSRVEIAPANQKPVETGLYSTWAESLKRTEHFIAYSGYVRELNRIYSSRDSGKLRQLMENRYGKAMVNYIDNYIKELANPEANAAQSRFDKIIRKMRGKTAPAYLGWKLSGIIKQACTSPWPFMQFIGPEKYLASVFKFITKPELRDAIKAKSAYMNSRVFDPIVDLVNEQKKKAENPLEAKLSKFESIGMQGLEWIDWMCVAPGWLAVYQEEVKRLSSDKEQNKLVEAKRKELESFRDVEGDEWIESEAEKTRLSSAQIEELAVQKADDVTRMCQPSSRLTDLSPMFKNREKGSELQRTILQFTTSLNVIWQNIRYDIPAAMRQKQFKNVIGIIAGYTLAGITVGLLTQGINRGIDDDDDDEEKAKKRVLNLLYYSLTQYTDAVPVIGSTITNIADSITSGKGISTTSSDLFPVVTKALKGTNDVIKAVNADDEEKAKKAWIKACNDWGYSLGLTIGLPVSGIKEAGALVGIGDDDGELSFNPGALAGRR